MPLGLQPLSPAFLHLTPDPMKGVAKAGFVRDPRGPPGTPANAPNL